METTVFSTEQKSLLAEFVDRQIARAEIKKDGRAKREAILTLSALTLAAGLRGLPRMREIGRLLAQP